MAGKKVDEVKNVKLGRYILIDEVPCKVVGLTHSKPGKHGGAKFRIDAVGIFDGGKRSIIKPAGDKIEVPMIDKRGAQVLAIVGSNVQLMDSETYDTFELPMPPDDVELTSPIAQGKEVIYMEVMGKRMIIQVKGEAG
ncbi:Translation initiation factor 5A [uncultured archaeon]|nr:Translation initiation factor 5A [uncultured archaeon]